MSKPQTHSASTPFPQVYNTPCSQKTNCKPMPAWVYATPCLLDNPQCKHIPPSGIGHTLLTKTGMTDMPGWSGAGLAMVNCFCPAHHETLLTTYFSRAGKGQFPSSTIPPRGTDCAGLKNQPYTAILKMRP
jgi:hypothetical protein